MIRPIIFNEEETVYAVIVKTGSHYAVRIKFADRDNGDGLWWTSLIFAEYLSSRAAAQKLAEDRGFITVPTWRQARQDYRARQRVAQ